MKTCRIFLFCLLPVVIATSQAQAMSVAGEPAGTSAFTPATVPSEVAPDTITTLAEITAVSEAKQSVSLNGIALPLANGAAITPAYGTGALTLGDLRVGMRVRAQVSTDQKNRRILALWIMK